MTASESARARAELSSQLLGLNEQMAPIFDTADGIRADLERRGYSPTASEAVAGEWLMGAMRQVWQVSK